MTEEKIYSPKSHVKNPHLGSMEEFQSMYKQSIESPNHFFAKLAKDNLSWSKDFDETHNGKFSDTSWFSGGELNVSYNCIDRHLKNSAQKTAIIWEGDEIGDSKEITFQELHDEVCKFANVLKNLGAKKSSRVCIYMPMIPEVAYAMLACTRIGAIHSVVFGGFAAKELATRIDDATPKVLLTASCGLEFDQVIPYLPLVDEACQLARHTVSTRIILQRKQLRATLQNGDLDWQAAIARAEPVGFVEVPASHPLYILYTSGTTGKPKGVVRDHGGHAVALLQSMAETYGVAVGDVFWAASDVGWVVGHSYIVYAPLMAGCTTILFEGKPVRTPDAGTFWRVIETHGVNVFFTAPTAFRAIRKEDPAGDRLKDYDLSSLRQVFVAGERTDPSTFQWLSSLLKRPIIDHWWQTETGGHMLTPLPGATDLKPGSATQPFFGVQPILLDTEGNEINGEGEGLLMIKASWPSQIRSVYGDHKRCIATYFSAYPGYYFTGDGAKRDADGYYWITGRVDDVLNVSGHRMGTAEVESALVLHEKVAEAAVVGYPHDIKGQGIYCYVTLMSNVEPDDVLKAELIALCNVEIGPIAKPDVIQWAPGLPKTRSGKIMRRILRKVAANELDNLGDTSTLADPGVVEELIANRHVK